MKIKPLADKVVVEALSEDEKVTKTKFGIVIPDTVDNKKVDRGTVIAVGSGKIVDGKKISMEVKVGDMVIFSEYSADKIKVDDKEYYIMGESSILAIIE
ncbi:MAG: co-chaperone GroES [Candidatus Marinimicrobia bacterium]|nr:co-chaperone GroES [Candidatus Neomarinimicrobiota bacterium]